VAHNSVDAGHLCGVGVHIEVDLDVAESAAGRADMCASGRGARPTLAISGLDDELYEGVERVGLLLVGPKLNRVLGCAIAESTSACSLTP